MDDRLYLDKISEISGISADRMKWFASVASTNDYAKAAAMQNPSLFAVAAEMQTAGRGRRGRSFFSPEGTGIYVSILVRQPFSAEECMRLTPYAAVATAQAVAEVCGLQAGIKWVNDLQYDGKKFCGILTEPVFSQETGHLLYAVVGIGINTGRRDFPPELAEIATSLENVCGCNVDRNLLCGCLFRRFANPSPQVLSNCIKEYRKRSVVIGKQIRVLRGTEAYDADCVDILDDGSLLIRTANGMEQVTTGEISIRIK